MATFKFSKAGVSHNIPLMTDVPTTRPFLKLTKGSSTLYCAMSTSKGEYDIKIGNYYLIGQEVTDLEGWTVMIDSNPDTARQSFYVTHTDFTETQTGTDAGGKPIYTVTPETKTYQPGASFTIRRASNGLVYDEYQVHTDILDNYYQVGDVSINKNYSNKTMIITITAPTKVFADIGVTQSAHQTIYVSYNGTENTTGFTKVPVGAVVSARVVAEEHYNAGGLNGTANTTMDVTVTSSGWTFSASSALEYGKHTLSISNTDTTNQNLTVTGTTFTGKVNSGSVVVYNGEEVTVKLELLNSEHTIGNIKISDNLVPNPYTFIVGDNDATVINIVATPSTAIPKYNVSVANTDTNQRLTVTSNGETLLTNSGTVSVLQGTSISVTLASTNTDFKRGDLLLNGSKVTVPFTGTVNANMEFTVTPATEAGGWKPDTLRGGEVLELPDLITTVNEDGGFSYWNNQLGVPQVSSWEKGRDVDHVIEFNIFIADSTLKENGGNTSLDWMEVGIGGIRYSQTLTGVSTDPNGGALPFIREQQETGVLYTTYLLVPACADGDTTDTIGIFAQGATLTPSTIIYRVRWSNITDAQTPRGTITRGAK